MKKTMMTVLGIALSALAMAGGDNDRVEVKSDVQDGKLNVYYLEKTPATIDIYIEDEAGRTIIRDHIKSQNGFYRPYNMQALEKGIYNISLYENGQLIHSAGVIVDGNKSAVHTKSNQRFQLSFVDKTPQEVTVGIFNKEGDLLHKESIRSNAGFSRIYNLSKVEADSYTFEVSSKNKVERHKI